MDPKVLERLKELEGVRFQDPKEAKNFLRTLKRTEPETYRALVEYYEECRKPQILDGVLKGERTWDVTITDEGFRLISAHGTIWPTYEALKAECSGKPHKAPSDGCDCGIYACLPGRSPWFEKGLYGTVKLWGKFIEGSERVYKAEFGYPETFDKVHCGKCSRSVAISETCAFLTFHGTQREGLVFACKTHLRKEGPLRNLYVPGSYVVDELRKEYGLEQPTETLEGFIESLDLEGLDL